MKKSTVKCVELPVFQCLPHCVTGGKRILGKHSAYILNCPSKHVLHVHHCMGSSKKHPSLCLKNKTQKIGCWQLGSNKLGIKDAISSANLYKTNKLEALHNKWYQHNWNDEKKGEWHKSSAKEKESKVLSRETLLGIMSFSEDLLEFSRPKILYLQTLKGIDTLKCHHASTNQNGK